MKIIKKIVLLLIILASSQMMKGRDFSTLLCSSLPSTPNEMLIYLHTDRSYYIPGESILFKAYILEKSDIKSNAIDSLRITLLDQEGIEVARSFYPIDNSMISGTVILPEFLAEGSYMLVASTRLTNDPPQKLFSKVIEIRNVPEYDLTTNLSLSDTLYAPGSSLTAQLMFTGSKNLPASINFKYLLTGNKGEILSGKGKSDVFGKSSITLKLPEFDKQETMTLSVTPSYKGNVPVTGIVIPTQFNSSGKIKLNTLITGEGEYRKLKILVKPVRQQDKKVQLDITVTDEQGSPVMANLSVSASNIVPQQLTFTDDNIISYSLKNSQTQADPNTDSQKYFIQSLLQLTQSPGTAFIVQDKNSAKKMHRRLQNANKMDQGYPPNLSIFDILMQIKAYHIDNGKITFGPSNSINNLDGALIVIDGIKMGSDIEVLRNISVPDIAHISISTNAMDIQKYTAMNNVGIIEITMKHASLDVEKEVTFSNTLFWGPEIITDNQGKASVNFINNEKTNDVMISVNGISVKGVCGTSSIKYSVQ